MRIYKKPISIVQVIVMKDCLSCPCKNNSIMGMSDNSMCLKPNWKGLGTPPVSISVLAIE